MSAATRALNVAAPLEPFGAANTVLAVWEAVLEYASVMPYPLRVVGVPVNLPHARLLEDVNGVIVFDPRVITPLLMFASVMP